MAEPRYICLKCGKPGVVDPEYTKMDGRYATGKCTGEHVGKQYLVREGTKVTEFKPKSHDG